MYTHLYDTFDVVYDSRSDTTDATGHYELTELVPFRDYEVYVQLGRDVIDKFIVGVDNESVEIPAGACAPNAELAVAVVTGIYDDLAPVVSSIGVGEVRSIDGQVGSELLDFLLDPAQMASHDVILFDGGHKEDGVFYGAGPVGAVHDNLRAFVQAGGVVYATDWAYDIIAQVWPDRIDFYGDDAVPDAAQFGDAATVPAEVVDVYLAEALSSITLDISYDLPGWPVIESVSPQTRIYVQGDAPYRIGLTAESVIDSPLLVSFDDDGGQVWFSTFRTSVNDDAQMVELLRYALLGGSG